VAALLALPATGAVAARAKRGGVQLVERRGAPLPGRWQSWADASLMPTVSGRVTIRLARCPDLPRAAGCVYTRRPRQVWLRSGAGDPRGALLHELGHVFDLLVMSNSDRAAVKRILRRPAEQPWWRGRVPVAEHFAEGYSWCARYARIHSLRGYASYRYDPTPAQHRRLCALIRRAAADRTPPQPAPGTPATTRADPPAPPPPSPDSGTVPGDPQHDPGPTPPEDPHRPPAPVPVPPPAQPPAPPPAPPASPAPPAPPPVPPVPPPPATP
jgi:hypothetical protein